MFSIWIVNQCFVLVQVIIILHFLLHADGLLSNFAAEIVMFDGYIVVYKFVQDLHFFVTGGDNENELILATVLQGFVDAVGLILRLVNSGWYLFVWFTAMRFFSYSLSF